MPWPYQISQCLTTIWKGDGQESWICIGVNKVAKGKVSKTFKGGRDTHKNSFEVQKDAALEKKTWDQKLTKKGFHIF